MNNKKKKYPMSYRGYCAAVISVMLVAVLLAFIRTAAVLRDYESGIQYFKSGSVLAAAFTGGAIALVICAFVLPFFVDKGRFAKELPLPGRAEYALCFTSAAAIVAYAVLEAKEFFERVGSGSALTGQSFSGRYHVTSGICVLLAVGFAAYLVLTALGKPADRRVRAVIGCLGVAFIIVKLLALYFDTSSPINSPIKTLDQMANSAALLYLAGELRMTVSDARPRFALRTGVAAFALMFPSAVSKLIGSFSGALPQSDAKVLYALFELSFSLYIAARVYALLLRKAPAKAAPADAESEQN